MVGNTFRVKTLASAVGIALITAGVAMPAWAASTSTSGKTISAELSTTPDTYIIRFAEAGLMHYSGGVQGIPATGVDAASSHKLDSRSAAAQSYKSYLNTQRAAHVAAVSQALGRTLVVTHNYGITMNGVAAKMTADEAARIAHVPGVASVRASRKLELATYRGPEFIGASSIWDGTATPSGVASRGEGVVVGVIDTGANSVHPSFADDETCGFDSNNHKLLSAGDCPSTDGSGACDGPNPEADDGNGHGVHTSSTAVGNKIDSTANPPPTIPAPHTFMSGVAQCSHLRTYKVCPDTGCSDAAITAGIENAIADQVDVINYSIGPTCGSTPGDSPWSDGDLIWLDALNADIFVAASAGNTRANCTNPVGLVANISPWVITVAASTHDENVSGVGILSATGPGTPPGNTQNIQMLPGSGLDPGQPLSDAEIRFNSTNPIGCTANGAFPPGFFDNSVALIQRGTCTFEEKINNAQAAGAILAIISNNTTGTISMSVGAATLPAYSTTQADGLAVQNFITANGSTPTTVDFTPAAQQGDVLAGFSFRGPDVLTTITKPDITGPGVGIYAALDAAENSYGFLSGTSMSSPHTAGSGALLRAVHPEWTPSEVKSALMLTAFTGGTEEDGTTPWTPDDVGSGRIDLTKAALVGFVLDETYDNYLAADPDQGGDPTTLNIASMRNVDGCDAPNPCTWTRTVTNVLSDGSSWTASVNAPAGVTVTVDPPSFTFTGTGRRPNGVDEIFADGFDGAPAGETQALTITATTDSTLSGAQFAEVVFHEANGAAPDAHMYVAVKGTSGGGGGGGEGVVCDGGNCTFQVDELAANFSGIGCATYCGLVWLNRFTPDPADYPITITTISTIFGSGAGWNALGDHINFYVYQDSDDDPSNGATLVGEYQGYTMPAPVNDFTTITLPTPIVVNGPGDVIIALTNPAPNTGTRPASADSGPFAGRSWLAGFDDEGTAPDLSSVGLLLNPDAIAGFSGNWLIRATGTNAGGRPIVLGMPDKK